MIACIVARLASIRAKLYTYQNLTDLIWSFVNDQVPVDLSKFVSHVHQTLRQADKQTDRQP